MAKKKQKSKLKKQIIDSFVLTIIASIGIFIVYKIITLISSPVNTYILKESTIYEEESKVGYIIRTETLIESTEGKNSIEPIKNEGEKVATGNPIFKYYNVDENTIKKQIDELNIEIQEALLGKTDLYSSDVKSIEGQIEKQINLLMNENNMQHVLEYKNSMSEYIVKKAKIAGSLSAAGEYINGLISKRNSLEKELTNGANYVYSKTSGVVSYRIDGLEDKLTVDNLDNLSMDYLESLNLTTAQVVSKSNNNAKVIDNFECYIAVPFKTEELKQTSEGKDITLRLSNKEEIKANVYKIIEDGKDKLVIFKITDNVENLINYRKISLDVIWWKYSGLIVPKSAIIYENGLSYIVRKKNGSMEKVLVNIIKENKNYYIIDNYKTEELLEMGYKTDEVNNIKKIKMYDEIVIDPVI